MPNRFHSSLILIVVFVLGISAGVGSMIWAWPAFKARFLPHKRGDFSKTLGLSPEQMTQVQSLFKQTGEARHTLHLQFAPQYAQVCEEYTTIRQKERDAYAPIQAQTRQKLNQILTAQQQQKWDAMQKQQAPQGMRVPDLCHRNDSPPPHGGPGNGPGGNGPGHGPGSGLGNGPPHFYR